MWINYAEVFRKYEKMKVPATVRSRIAQRMAHREKLHRVRRIRKKDVEYLIKELLVYAVTDNGSKTRNEDFYCIYNVENTVVSGQTSHESRKMKLEWNSSAACLFAVADGISSLPDSMHTSERVVRALIERYPTISLEHGVYMKRAIQSVNRSIARENEPGVLKGSTVAAVYLEGDHICCANVGDSAVYLIRRNTMEKITRDDTEGQEMIEAGIEERQIPSGMFHTLTQFIGQPAPVNPHIRQLTVHCGDILIIMSDAFIPEIRDVMGSMNEKNPAEALIQSFYRKQRGQYLDNSTLLMVVFKSPDGGNGK